MKRAALALLILVAMVGTIALFASRSDKPASPTTRSEYLTPASVLRDAHGLAVDMADPKKVWIASHNGLNLLIDDKELFAVGSKRDDYMGFTIHPTDPDTFFSSGHPASGGNIGFQKSTDGGRTWTKLADGVGGPVDFHAIAISQADPNIVYGMYRGQLQKSTDGGVSWQLIVNAPQAVMLATNYKDKHTVYAVTQDGLQVSTDQGNTWTDTSLNGVVFAVAINPVDAQEMLASTKDKGLVKSVDGGLTWQSVSNDDPQGITYIAYSKNDPKIMYALAQDLSLHKSVNSGQVWQKVR